MGFVLTMAADKLIAKNKKAYFDYEILDEFEAGICLAGSEVKSLKCNSASINEAFVCQKKGELWLSNMHIPHYKPASKLNHHTTRSRKLLLHKRQIKKIAGTVHTKGLTLAVLSVYSNKSGWIKAKICTARGKKKHDKRQSIKEKDWQRQQARRVYE
jgi:SsrA-binding protein